MSKIKSLEDLRKLRDQVHGKMDIRERSNQPEQQVQVRVAMATCGIAAGAKETMSFLVDALEKRGVDAIVTQTGCMGYCYAEPTIEVTLPGKDPVVFGDVTPKKADEIIERYIKGGELVDGLIPEIFRRIEE